MKISRLQLSLYYQFWVFGLVRFALVLFMFIPLYAEAQQIVGESAQIQLEEEKIQIVDTTQIVLEPRKRFNDPSKPKLIHSLALYAKERLWNLPPNITPNKSVYLDDHRLKDYHFSLIAYPSLPESLFYKLTLTGQTNQTNGFVSITRNQIGSERTDNRGNYSLDLFHGGFGYRYAAHSSLKLNLGMKLKELNWKLKASQLPVEFKLNSKTPKLIWTDVNLNQKITKKTKADLSVRFESYELDSNNQIDSGKDLRINLDIFTDFPPNRLRHILNPMHFGGVLEYRSIATYRTPRNMRSSTFRLYVRDQYSTLGPMIFDLGGEFVSFLESGNQLDANLTEIDEEPTKFRLNPSLSTIVNLNSQWKMQVELYGATEIPQLSAIYFDQDYVNVLPALRSEKIWCGQITLKRYYVKKFEVDFSGFSKLANDLVILKRDSRALGKASEIAWIPYNFDQKKLISGGQLLVKANLLNQLSLNLKLKREFHRSIPYRATDWIDLDLVYYLPLGFKAKLVGEFRGGRSTEEGSQNLGLEDYVLMRPKLAKQFGNYMNGFIGGVFVVGKYMQFTDYLFTPNAVVFGLELEF